MWLTILWGWLRPIIITIATDLLAEGGERLYTVARAVVAELQNSNLSNGEKREEAVKRILAIMKSEGLEFGESIVRELIENTLRQLKKKQAIS